MQSSTDIPGVVSGYRYEAGTSQRSEATLTLRAGMLEMTDEDGRVQMARSSELEISDRIANIKRKILWPNGELFETDDNDAIDRLLAQNSGNPLGSVTVHRMERSWGWVAIAGLVTVAVTVAFFVWGLPAMSYKIAHALPVKTHEVVSSGAMKTMDQFFFQPTALSVQEQEKLSQRFINVSSDIDLEGFTLKLHFRRMNGIANALALPSGDIVVTDALVDMVEAPEELDAVLLHEIGHVLERHGMQHVVHASTMTVIASLAIGDVTGVNELITGFPIFLMQSNYSRKSEAGADEFAFEYMMRSGIDPAHFAAIITKLGAQGRLRKEEENPDIDGEKELSDYLASHPSIESRAERAMEVSKEYNEAKAD